MNMADQTARSRVAGASSTKTRIFTQKTHFSGSRHLGWHNAENQ